MNQEARHFVSDFVDEIDEEAVYLLVRTPGGLQLEDFAPLLGEVETLYRRLFVLRLDRQAVTKVAEHQSRGEDIRGLSRSLTYRYRKLVLPKDEEYSLAKGEKRFRKELWKGGILDQIQIEKEFLPSRVEIGRSTTGSPGIVELVGDPATLRLILVTLSVFLVYLQRERHHQENRELALRDDQPAGVEDLSERLDATQEEIEQILDYLSRHSRRVVRELEDAQVQVAPGDRVDPTADEDLEYNQFD